MPNFRVSYFALFVLDMRWRAWLCGVVWLCGYFSLDTLSAQVIPKSYDRASRATEVKSDTMSLEEVLVEVPYGKVKKQTFVGAAESINQKQISNRVATSFVNKLDGQVPGLQIGASTRPGGSAPISIRGGSSIFSGKDPLIIVNGMQYGGELSNINPDDIENIEILKDASATALYGSRAANGVILVTTKTGKHASKRFQVSVKSSWGTSLRFIPEEKRANPEQYYELIWEVIRNNVLSPYITGRQPVPAQVFEKAGQIASQSLIPSLGNYNIYNVPKDKVVLSDGKINPEAFRVYTPEDWSKAFLQTKLRSENTVSIAGNSDDNSMNYYVSANYLKDPGIITNSDFDRYGFLANLDAKMSHFIKVGSQLNYRQSRTGNALSGSSSFSDPFNTSLNMPSIYPVYVHNPETGEIIIDPQTGKPIYDFGNGIINPENNEFYRNAEDIPQNVDKQKLIRLNRPQNAFNNSNSIGTNYLDVRNSEQYEFSGRAYVELTFLPGLSFRSNAGLDYSYSESILNQNSQFGTNSDVGSTTRSSGRSTTINLSQVLNFHRSLGLNNFQITAGHEILLFSSFAQSGSRRGYLAPRLNELAAGTTVSSATSVKDLYRLQGLFFRLSYDYDNRYFIEGSVRGDQSSVFRPGKQWGLFYSVGAGWNLDRELWFSQTFPFFSSFKLKASWGITGNDGSSGSFGNYQYQATYDPSYADLNLPGAIQDKIGTPNITWEQVGKTNVGLEIGFLQNRLKVNLDGFYNPVNNMLFFRPVVPSVAGLPGLNQNIGSMFNAGFEWSVNGVAINPRQEDGLRLELGINGFWNTNRITKLPPENAKTGLPAGATKYMVGGSTSDLYFQKFKGFDEFGYAKFLEKTGDRDKDGKLIYLKDAKGETIYDKDGDPAIQNQRDTITTDYSKASRYMIRGILPIMTGGINVTVSFKGFQLYVLFKYKIGGKVIDGVYQSLMTASPDFGSQIHADMYTKRANFKKQGDYYVVDSHNGTVPLLGPSSGLYANRNSDRFLVDASYFMLKNITLSYSLPKSVSAYLKMSNISFFFTVENIFVISHLKQGANPEGAGGSGSYPTLRSIVGGVKFDF